MSSCGLPESVWLPLRSLAILNFVRPYRGRAPGRSCASSWEPLASCDDRRGNTMTVERVAVKDLKLNEPVTSFFQVRNPQRRLRKTGELLGKLAGGGAGGPQRSEAQRTRDLLFPGAKSPAPPPQGRRTVCDACPRRWDRGASRGDVGRRGRYRGTDPRG